MACPRDFPYHGRFCAILGENSVFELPHRKFSLGALLGLWRFCRARRVTMLHSHGKGAGLYGRLLAILTGLPCVHTFHGVHMAAYGPVKRRFYRLYERTMACVTRAGIAVSEGERRRILAEGLMPEKKLLCIPNGVDIPPEPTPGATGSPWHVVSMSRFDYQKNSAFLFAVLDSLNTLGRRGDFRFTLIGDGPEKPGMAAMARELGVAGAIRFAGATPEPHAFFPGSLCCFSSSRWEGLPLAILEAMAHGLPAVASNVTGNRDAVAHEETGLLYHEGDASAAASALCRLADVPDFRDRLAKNARDAAIRNHDARHMAARTWAVLAEES